jgi:hypothetical protein
MEKMGLGNKSLKINSRKALAIALTVALAIATLGALLALTPAQAQGTIALSSSNLNPFKVIAITVKGAFGDQVTIQVLNPNGVECARLTAPKVGVDTYVAYLGGENANPPSNPLSPAFEQLPRGSPKGIYTVVVLGTDLTTTFTYGTVVAKLTIGVKEVAYRRADVVIPITIVDQDLNYDPTARDERPADQISVIIQLVKAEGGTVTVPTDLDTLIDGQANGDVVTESSPNSGTFETSTSLSVINQLLAGAPGGRQLYKDDKVLITISVSADAQGGANWGDADVSTDYFTAVYRAPKVEVLVDSKKLTIRVTSPDDNVNPNARDTLDSLDYNNNNIPDIAVDLVVGTASARIPSASFQETDKNTGVFECSLDVQWGTAYSINLGGGVVVFKTGVSSVYIEAAYHVVDADPRPLGYGVDATGSAVYKPVAASIDVVKATPKSFVFKVSDSDLNNRARSVDYLIPNVAVPAPAVVDITLYKDYNGNEQVDAGEPAVARVVIKDIYGNPVALNLPAGRTLRDFLSFVETDFDTGVFALKMRSEWLGIQPGATYFLEYTDYTGPSTVTTVQFTVVTLEMKLDRTELPVNRINGVEVVVTYVNDFYNNDPSVKDSVQVSAQIVRVDNTVINVGPVTLTETDIDSGVFEGTLVIGAGQFSSPAIIDATLRVYDNAFNKEAKGIFRAHDSSVEVSATVVKFGDKITIKVKDPDANYKTYAKDSVSITLSSWTAPITLYETDVNSGEFAATFTVSWDDVRFRVEPGTTITVRYVDDTPIMSPTATSWRTVPYMATFSVATFNGELLVPTAEEGYVGALEEFDVVVKDPDLNRYVKRADNPTTDAYVREVIAVAFEGIPVTATYSVSETGANTGVFALSEATGFKLSLTRALQDAGILTGGLTPRQRAEVMAQYIGKKVTISYVDDKDASGARRIVNKVLTIKAWDAVITTSKEAVNLGEWLIVNVTNKDIAGTTVPDYKMVVVRSDSYPAGLMFYVEEVEPGVFQLKIQVVDVNKWVPGAKQIPAKLGDRITIEYVDPVTSDGKAYVPVTKTVLVGVPVERPVPASEQKFLDVTGAEKKVGKVGETVMLSTKVQNVDVVDREFTAIFQVKDERGAVVYIAWITAKLAPGTSMTPAVSWTPAVKGTYTVEVLVVKSIAEPTPYSDKISAPFTVQ